MLATKTKGSVTERKLARRNRALWEDRELRAEDRELRKITRATDLTDEPIDPRDLSF